MTNQEALAVLREMQQELILRSKQSIALQIAIDLLYAEIKKHAYHGQP